MKKNSRYQKFGAAGQLPLITPDSDWEAPQELPNLIGRELVALDLECKDDGLAAKRGPGWPYRAGYICGISYCAGDDTEGYIPIRHPDSENFDEDAVRRWYTDLVRSDTPVVFQNGPFDIGWTGTMWGAPPPTCLDDTIAMANILDENRYTYGLDALCKWRGIQGKDKTKLLEAASAYGVDPVAGLWRLPARYVGTYGTGDSRATRELAIDLKGALEKESLSQAYRLEADLIPLVVAMRRNGIRIDQNKIEQARVYFMQRRDDALARLSEKISQGRRVSIEDVNSPRWLERVFDAEKLPYPENEKSEYGSFDADWMGAVDHWLPQNVVRARKYENAQSKFVANYIQSFLHMGRLHAEIHQYRDDRGGTRTTRLSYSDPPLQQIPSPKRGKEVGMDIGKRIRQCFQPEEGCGWFAPDYNQQEYRLIVHFSEACGMAGAEVAGDKYRSDPKTDFHRIVVEMTGLPRPRAKDCNFAKAYRAGVAKFALMIGQSQQEAQAIYDLYDDKFPFMSRMAEFCDSRAQSRGFLILIDGAKAHFDRWETRWLDRDKWARGQREGKPMEPCSLEEARRRAADKDHPWFGERLRRADTYKAMNKLIQGSAARQTKMAMRACWQMGYVPLIQMHDELCFSFDNERDGLRVSEAMRTVVTLKVPTVVDDEWGDDWGSANYSWEEWQQRRAA